MIISYMSNKIKQLYALIQKDLKAEGWDDDAISEAIAECIKERRATGADEETICVTELSYLSKDSLDLLTKTEDKQSENNNAGIGGKKTFFTLIHYILEWNWKLIIGVLFLILPVICAFYVIYDLFFDANIIGLIYRFDFVSRLAYEQYEYHVIVIALLAMALLLYFGLMAIAGAILIKGCFKKDNKQ